MRRTRKRITANITLDLTPVLSVIIHMIPMLLILVRFRQLAEVSVQQPVVPTTVAPSSAAFATQTQKIVSVTITAEGYLVGGTGDAIRPIPCEGPCGPKSYDTVGLTEMLKVASLQHPGEKRVVIAPAPRVPYEIVVATMDAARSYATEGKVVPLFPEAILATPAPRGVR